MKIGWAIEFIIYQFEFFVAGEVFGLRVVSCIFLNHHVSFSFDFIIFQTSYWFSKLRQTWILISLLNIAFDQWMMNLKFFIWFRNYFWILSIRCFRLFQSARACCFRNVQGWRSLTILNNFTIIYYSLIVALLSCVIYLSTRILFRIFLSQNGLIFAQSNLILHLCIPDIWHINMVYVFVILILLVSPLVLLILRPIILFALSWRLVIVALLPRFVLICSHKRIWVVRNISRISWLLLLIFLHYHINFWVLIHFFHHLNILSMWATHVTLYNVLIPFIVHWWSISFFHFHHVYNILCFLSL